MSTDHDVLVIGAGPAGSTAATLLAQAGHSVLVLEKETFPRFRIGESLLPACVPILKRIGVEPRADTFVEKRGAEFICEETGRAQSFAFNEVFPGCPTYAWHVERASFDTLLRDRARAVGAEVRHGEGVKDAGVEGDTAWVETSSGKMTGRFLLDASGQGRLLARRMGSVEHYTNFGTAAVFTHFDQVDPSAMDELGPGFEVRIMVRPEGWGWIIPLPSGRLSVGMVGRGKITPEDLDAGLLAGPLMRRLASGARRQETHIVGNFSYQNTSPRGPRYSAVGDSAIFLDPVFSSGVTLALRGAEGVADRLSPALEAGTEGAADLLDEHQAGMDRACKTFYSLIHRFYHSNLVHSFFLRESASNDMRVGIMSVLAGHVWRTDNPFQEMLLNSRQIAPTSVDRSLV